MPVFITHAGVELDEVEERVDIRASVLAPALVTPLESMDNILICAPFTPGAENKPRYQ
jgi:hypothetical protein